MSMFPSPLLSKLQDLKLWQGNYDQLLQNKSSNSTGNPSDYESIQGLSALDTSRSNENSPVKNAEDWDKIVISPMKPFEVLLEEKLAENIIPDDPKEQKPKKPFLKKGSGLIRFKSKTEVSKQSQKHIKKPVNQSLKNVQSKNQTKKVTTTYNGRRKGNPISQLKPQQVYNITPLRIPDMEIKPKAQWIKAPSEESNSDASPQSPQKFSFYQKKKEAPKTNRFSSEILEKINEFALKQFCSPKKKDDNKENVNNPVNLPSSELYKSLTTESDKELRIFEALEKRADDSSFCSTNSSIVRILYSTPNKLKLYTAPQKKIPEEPSDSSGDSSFCDEKTADIENKLKQLDEKTEVINNFIVNLRKFKEQSSMVEDSTQYESDITDKSTSISYSDFEKWNSSTETSPSTSPTLNESQNNKTLQNIAHSDAAVNTNPPEPPARCQKCDNLEKELTSYSRIIEELKRENRRLGCSNADIIKERDKFEAELERMKLTFGDERVVLKDEIEKAKKQLEKEKDLFNSYMKASKDRPSKKEREDMSLLKAELADVKELLKLKEAKNGATQARLRNQIKFLDKENGELKVEVEKLTKEKSKLNASQKLNRRPSDSKMLHEINKNLTKLTQEKRLSGGSVDSEEEKSDEKRKTVRLNGILKNKSGSSSSSKETLKNDSTALKTCVSTNSNDTTLFDASSFATLSVEQQYENVFGRVMPSQNMTLNDSRKEKTQVIHEDGSKEINYSNGNVKTISADGKIIKVKYSNGDLKETLVDDRVVKYFYANTETWLTTYEDGTEWIEFPDGQSEKKYTDGRCEVFYPDGVIQTIFTDGSEEAKYPDGSILEIRPNGERILTLTNGQKEIHTKEHKRREYPDGTVKIVYPDGKQETRYSNGRIRIKDGNGTLLMDTDLTNE